MDLSVNFQNTGNHIEKQTVLYATQIQRPFAAEEKKAPENLQQERGKRQAFYPIRGRDASTTRGNVQGEQGLPGQIYRSTVTKRAE
jgi:hypothetical protein